VQTCTIRDGRVKGCTDDANVESDIRLDQALVVWKMGESGNTRVRPLRLGTQISRKCPFHDMMVFRTYLKVPQVLQLGLSILSSRRVIDIAVLLSKDGSLVMNCSMLHFADAI